MRILVFGDSIAYGAFDSEGGWVERLRRHYMQQEITKGLNDTQPVVLNLSVPGEMTQGVIRRLNFEAAHRRGANKALIIIIAVGINDTMIYKGAASNTQELYGGELLEIMQITKQFTNKVAFAGLTSIDEKLHPQNADYAYTNERIWQFEKTLRRFCKEHKLTHVKLYEALKNKPDLFSADGLHPNEAGHKLITKKILNVLSEVLEE